MSYVTAVFSMRQRRRNPDAARLRIRVLSKTTFDRILDGDSVGEVLASQYRRWVRQDGFTACDTELEAWEAAIEMRQRMRSNNRAVDLLFGKPDFRLYVFEMNAQVVHNSAFVEMNAGLSFTSDHGITCAYVGMTSTSFEKRYDQHCSTHHKARTKWGRDYFLRPFKQAFRADLLRSFEESGHSNNVSGLTKYLALKGELELRCWLQDQCVAAYSK